MRVSIEPGVCLRFLNTAAVTLVVSAPALAAPTPARLSIASPVPNQLVGGAIQVAATYDTGDTSSKITMVSLYVDGNLYSNRPVALPTHRGTDYLDLDTRRLANGRHEIKVVVYAGKQVLVNDTVTVGINNGGVDIVPPLVSFRNILEGDVVSGKIDVEVAAGDNDQISLVSIFINRFPVLISNQPPFRVPLDTAKYMDPRGNGKLLLEAWAYDRSNNVGKARPLNLVIRNGLNNTPVMPDPAGDPMGNGGVNPGVVPAPGGGNATSVPSTPNVEPSAPGMISVPAGSPRTVGSARSTAPVGTQPLTVASSNVGIPQMPELGPSPTPARTLVNDPRLSLPAHIGRPAGPAVVDGQVRAPDIARGKAPTGRSVNNSRSSRPLDTRPASRQGAVEGDVRMPQMALNTVPRPSAIGPRATTPGVPKPGSRQVAKAPTLPDPRNVVKVAPVEPAPVPNAQLPTATQIEIPLPAVPGVEPVVVKPAAVVKPAVVKPTKVVRRTVPVKPAKRTQMAKAPTLPPTMPDGPMIVIPESGKKPGKNNRVAARVMVLNSRGLVRDRTYVVRKGETLKAIAVRHNVTPRSILIASNLRDGAAVRPGMKVRVPGTFDVVMGDSQIAFDVQPRIEAGVAIAPFRQIFEHTGGIVKWDGDTQSVQATNESVEVKIRIGSAEATVNQKVIVMDREAFIDSGRTMVPLRFMEESLDLKAEYDVKNKRVYLVRK